MNTSLAFFLFLGAFAVCVFLGALIVFGLRQSKTSRRSAQVPDGIYPVTWDGSGTAQQVSDSNTPHTHHHHHHHSDTPQHHHDASHHGSSGHDSGSGHSGGGHSGGFDGGGASHGGGFDGGGFGGGHH